MRKPKYEIYIYIKYYEKRTFRPTLDGYDDLYSKNRLSDYLFVLHQRLVIDHTNFKQFVIFYKTS